MPLEFSGQLLTYQNTHIVVYGPHTDALMALGESTWPAPVFLHPGYRFYTRPVYIIPTEVIDDIGQRFTPPDCYQWLEEQGDLYPRSDVIGFLDNGSAESVFVKELDLIEIALFAAPTRTAQTVKRITLAIDTTPPTDEYALRPVPFPTLLLDRAISCYRLDTRLEPDMCRAVLSRLLTHHFRDWRLTHADLQTLARQS